MAKITNEVKRIEGGLEPTDTVKLVVNDLTIEEFTVKAGNTATVQFVYQEQILEEPET